MAVKKLQNITTTTLNLPVNVIAALCYVPWVGWVVGIIVLLLEKNTELRWHAVHGLVIFACLMVLSMILGLTLILAPLAMIVGIGGLIVQVFAAVKVYGGNKPRFFKVSEWTDIIVRKLGQ